MANYPRSTGGATPTSHAPRWTDVTVQGVSLRLGVATPELAVFKGGVRTLQFGTGEEAHSSIQMPHEWMEGSEIRPHVHWSPMGTGTGDVVWGLECVIVPQTGDTVLKDAIYKTHTISSNSQYKALVSSFAAIDMTGMNDSTIILFRVFRYATGDTLAGDVSLSSVDFHYQRNSFGTVGEFA